MPKPTVDDLRQLQLTNRFRWDLDIVKQPIAGYGIILPSDLNIRCESVDIPSYPLKTIPIKIRNYNVSRPSNIDTVGSITMNVIETTDGIIYDFFSGWYKTIFDPELGLSNDKTLCEATILLTLLDNKDKAMRIFTLYGCLLSGYTRGTLGNEDIKPLSAQITLTYDFFKEQKCDILGNIADVAGVVTDLLGIGGPVPNFIKGI